MCTISYRFLLFDRYHGFHFVLDRGNVILIVLMYLRQVFGDIFKVVAYKNAF